MHASDFGDHIGMESCNDLEINTGDTNTGTGTDSALSLGDGLALNYRKPWGLIKSRSSMSARNVKELPPPLPIHTTTALKRYYTDDGRLIIMEEKIESPKYQFTAHRSHGRLTLRLVHPESRGKLTVDCDDDDDGGDGGGGGSRFGCNATVRAAVTGQCLFVDQNQLRAIRPVEI